MSSQTAENQPVREKKGKKGVLITAIVVIALAGLASGYYYFSTRGSGEEIACQNTKSVTLPSITVNLIDNGYFKTTITLEYVPSRKLDEELDTKQYKVKDSVLEVLRNTRTATLKNPQETEELKQELLEEINSKLVYGEVTGVFFEEFIVQ